MVWRRDVTRRGEGEEDEPRAPPRASGLRLISTRQPCCGDELTVPRAHPRAAHMTNKRCDRTLPFSFLTASCASRTSSYSMKAKPGGRRATHTLRMGPNGRNSSYRAGDLAGEQSAATIRDVPTDPILRMRPMERVRRETGGGEPLANESATSFETQQRRGGAVRQEKVNKCRFH